MSKTTLHFMELFVCHNRIDGGEAWLFGLNDLFAFAGLFAREVHRMRKIVKLTLA